MAYLGTYSQLAFWLKVALILHECHFVEILPDLNSLSQCGIQGSRNVQFTPHHSLNCFAHKKELFDINCLTVQMPLSAQSSLGCAN